MFLISSLKFRLETLNEKRSGVVQMVKLAEKERDNLEVCGRLSGPCHTHTYIYTYISIYIGQLLTCFWKQDVKNEAETYMLKELTHLKWQEKATQMAYENTVAKISEQQQSLQSLENNLKDER